MRRYKNAIVAERRNFCHRRKTTKCHSGDILCAALQNLLFSQIINSRFWIFHVYVGFRLQQPAAALGNFLLTKRDFWGINQSSCTVLVSSSLHHHIVVFLLIFVVSCRFNAHKSTGLRFISLAQRYEYFFFHE